MTEIFNFFDLVVIKVKNLENKYGNSNEIGIWMKFTFKLGTASNPSMNRIFLPCICK